MKSDMNPSLDDTIAIVLERWPYTAEVFKRLGMADCLGCAMAPFESVAEASATFGLDAQLVLSELRQAVMQEEPR